MAVAQQEELMKALEIFENSSVEQQEAQQLDRSRKTLVVHESKDEDTKSKSQ